MKQYAGDDVSNSKSVAAILPKTHFSVEGSDSALEWSVQFVAGDTKAAKRDDLLVDTIIM